ncbi:hypothetical protein TOK_4491 [Pseudonocardia sp. N23]|nr:hypothetical protein TOK_4491 [Pseudonocardia sp. N23]
MGGSPVDDVRDVAFGADPGRAVVVAPGAPAANRWAAAVALGGQGHYARAATLLLGLLHDPAAPRVVAAHAAVTLASHRRQLGGHAAARRLDALGLRLASDPGIASRPAGPDGPSAVAARADALVGLAADALGIGDLCGSRRLLDVARAVCEAADAATAPDEGRCTVRAGWVTAELELVSGNAVAATRAAAGAARRAAGSRSSRHRVKSAMVAGVSRAVADPATAPEALLELDALAGAALALGLLPLHWPAALAAADLADRPGVAEAAAERSAEGVRKARRWADALGLASGAEVACHPPDGPVRRPVGRQEPRRGATRSALPSASRHRPSDVAECSGSANDRQVNRSSDAPNDTVSDAPRRRHAAALTLGVLYSRSDPIGRRLMGESAWVAQWLGVM